MTLTHPPSSTWLAEQRTKRQSIDGRAQNMIHYIDQLIQRLV